MNSSDPRMAAIRDYATAYAAAELAGGADTVPTDVTLDDEALRAALQAAAKPGTVIDDATLAWAKDLLGVGPAVGKIDQIREELAATTVDPGTDPDTVTDPDTGTDPGTVTDPDTGTDPGTDVGTETGTDGVTDTSTDVVIDPTLPPEGTTGDTTDEATLLPPEQPAETTLTP
ncbi:hypothetical protein FJQ55_05560 [Rhizobium glycinendophyticum]|uniref:Uncharacterized protein n=2 Tax=Rhizobium glycinendophyticum TaxID=2589807 RepID=A0A504U7A0_9HYPH|nr:hypothetical protein FJQ55_05560 [Rhizobium glycinendophyticum]